MSTTFNWDAPKFTASGWDAMGWIQDNTKSRVDITVDQPHIPGGAIKPITFRVWNDDNGQRVADFIHTDEMLLLLAAQDDTTFTWTFADDNEAMRFKLSF